MKNTHPCTRTVLCVVITLGLGLVSAAQAAPPSPGTILQQTLPSTARPTAPAPVLTLPAPEQQVGQATARIAVRKIVIEGNALIPASALQHLVKGLQGRTVTLGELDEGASRITDYYRAHDYPLAYAYVPAQTIADGIVRIAVVEPRYDKISIASASRLKTGQAERTLGLEPGTPIEEAPLQRGLLLLNRTPGVQVKGTLVPGAQPGTSSLNVKLTNTPRVRGAVTVDNSGNDSTGRTRGLAEFNLDNPFGYGSQIAVNGLTTDGGLLNAGGFAVLSPDLSHGLRMSLYSSRAHYRLGGSFASLEENGRADQWGMGIGYPVVLAPGRLLEARLDLLRNDLRQHSDSTGQDDRSHINLARLSMDGALADSTGGMTSGGASLSQGRLGLDSTDAQAADAAGPHAAGSFWVGQVEMQRDQPLPRNFRLQLNLSGQLASKNLDGSQKFYLGGPDGVMSYPVGEAGGDEGALLRLKLAHELSLGLPGQLEGSLLAQYGEVEINRSSYDGATEPNHVHLGGAGIGLDYRWTTRLSAQLDYVHRLGDTTVQSGPDHRQQIWASLRLDI